MTQEIQEGLNRLFELLVPFSKEFNKRTYVDIFKDKYEEFRPLFSAIAHECETAENPDEALEEIARVMPDKMHEILKKEGTKRKQENVLMKYNLGMVAFVIPMFRYGRIDSCEKIVDRMVELWNDNGLSMDISKSTFEDIEGGFKSHFCYITTAVCQSLGKADDCYELNLLRDYRDGYLASASGGIEEINEYYNVAPTIVRRIGRMDDAGAIYQEIWERYLNPCVKLIEENRQEECREVYSDMVRSLEKKYLYS